MKFLAFWLPVIGLSATDCGEHWGATIPKSTNDFFLLRVNEGLVECVVLEVEIGEPVSGLLFLEGEFEQTKWLDNFSIPSFYEKTRLRDYTSIQVDESHFDSVLQSNAKQARSLRSAAQIYVEKQIVRRLPPQYNYPDVTNYLCTHLLKSENVSSQQSSAEKQIAGSEISQTHLSSSNGSTADTFEIDSFEPSPEGRKFLISHYRRERNRDLRSLKLAQERNSKGGIECAACGCQPDNKYFSDEIVEVHHIIPLAESGETTTSFDDLVILCPSCHVAVHKILAKDPESHLRQGDYTPIFSENFNNQRRQP